MSMSDQEWLWELERGEKAGVLDSHDKWRLKSLRYQFRSDEERAEEIWKSFNSRRCPTCGRCRTCGCR